MNQFQIPPQQQQAFNNRLFEEREKITMSWTNELRKWHPIALKALSFVSAVQLQIHGEGWRNLLTETTHGINMNVVGLLCNNLESRTPEQMGYNVHDWADVLELNDAIGKSWTALAEPVIKKVQKEFEIMQPKPKMVIAQA